MMLKNSIILLLCIFIMANAQTFSEPKLAPLNPEFVNYLEKLESGQINMMTDDGHYLGHIPAPMKIQSGIPPDFQFRTDLPSVYDMRLEGLVSTVKDQSAANTCWAFASLASVESRWLKMGLGEYDLSENNLKNRHGYLFHPNTGGGNSFMAAAYFSSFKGPVLESQDPYDPASATSPALDPVASIPNAWMPIGIGSAPRDTIINHTKQLLFDYGALWADMYYDNSYYNSANFTYWYHGPSDRNHDIALVGWDDNKVTAAPQPGAWIVKNSYGSSWGENGFFYISYYDSVAPMELTVWPDREPFQQNYHMYFYDDLGGIQNTGYNQATAYALIKFTAAGSYPIQRLSAWMADQGEISFWIYDDFNGGILSNLLGQLSNQSANYFGYYTFDLPTPLTIADGNDFYLKIAYNTPNWLAPIPVECAVQNFSNPAIETGKCWVSPDGSNWMAIGANTNYQWDLCARAYAAPAGSPPSIALDPSAFTFDIPENEKDTLALRIFNNAGVGGQDLVWSIEDRELTLRLANEPQEPFVPLTVGSGEQISAATSVGFPMTSKEKMSASAMGNVSLVLDDGSRERGIGLSNGGQIVWLNRFTPDPNDFPFDLTEIQILFDSVFGVNVGELVDIYIYEDTDGDGDPGTNANFLASHLNAAVQVADGINFSVYPISPITLNGPHDVLIAVVNRTAGTGSGEYPACMDSTASQLRSWIGAYSGNPGNPPVFPASGLWGLMDNFGYPGNWMIRGYGITAGGDALWLSENPINGTISAGTNQSVEIIADAAGLAQGTYQAELVITCNDPAGNTMQVPVTLNVLPPVKIDEHMPAALTFAVSQNYPNPFNPTTEIRFDLPTAQKVEIMIFNSLGQKVCTLLSANKPAGQHRIRWDGLTDLHQPVGSGVYFCQVRAGQYHAVRKMLLLR